MSTNSANSLAGQWIGENDGDPKGTMVMDLDSIDGIAKGVLYLYPKENDLPSSLAPIEAEDFLTKFDISCTPLHFIADNGYIPNWSELSARFPDVRLPQVVNGVFTPIDAGTIDLSWKTEIGTGGSARLIRSVAATNSRVIANSQVKTWAEFQAFVTDKPNLGWVFRGQSQPWPLMTSFHRTNRRDLRRYFHEDLPRLHNALSARTKHLFNLENPIELGAFFNLAQHHGFPTPLLDWTRSPFVAAFFAYKDTNPNQKEPIRIYAFNRTLYQQNHHQLTHLNLVKPHFSNLETLAIENERAIPQQGVLNLTNLEDIERFIQNLQEADGQTYLHAFDLPAHEAKKAIGDLRLMGITKASMFPGIESICEELRDLNFS